ncbi:hypothetical protein [Nocardioides sp. Leaf285]|uniref:hypothetical protein n=1 Tax=Nocardioides sp. Leaf285 TaxID=1736322 RepID=UPI0007032019|nr:hypothetical protein [Nocardioides sp. Leaf285]KQP64691.1 hypothetical protein ASF47_12280 [Nocardioides sp. Leaf285]
MPHLSVPVPSSLGLVDLLVALAVLLAVVGALRTGRGLVPTLLSAVGAGLAALAVAWVVTSVLSTWGRPASPGPSTAARSPRPCPRPTVPSPSCTSCTS